MGGKAKTLHDVERIGSGDSASHMTDVKDGSSKTTGILEESKWKPKDETIPVGTGSIATSATSEETTSGVNPGALTSQNSKGVDTSNNAKSKDTNIHKSTATASQAGSKCTSQHHPRRHIYTSHNYLPREKIVGMDSGRPYYRHLPYDQELCHFYNYAHHAQEHLVGGLRRPSLPLYNFPHQQQCIAPQGAAPQPAHQQYLEALLPLLRALSQQLDYYFSASNLPRDEYMQSIMEMHSGYVPTSVLATFPNVTRIVRSFDPDGGTLAGFLSGSAAGSAVSSDVLLEGEVPYLVKEAAKMSVYLEVVSLFLSGSSAKKGDVNAGIASEGRVDEPAPEMLLSSDGAKGRLIFAVGFARILHHAHLHQPRHLERRKHPHYYNRQYQQAYSHYHPHFVPQNDKNHAQKQWTLAKPTGSKKKSTAAATDASVSSKPGSKTHPSPASDFASREGSSQTENGSTYLGGTGDFRGEQQESSRLSDEAPRTKDDSENENDANGHRDSSVQELNEKRRTSEPVEVSERSSVAKLNEGARSPVDANPQGKVVSPSHEIDSEMLANREKTTATTDNGSFVLILREMPQDTTEEDVRTIFDSLSNETQAIAKLNSIRVDVGNCWFVVLDTASNHEAVSATLLELRRTTFRGKLIKARLKTESSVKSYYSHGAVPGPMQSSSGGARRQTVSLVLDGSPLAVRRIKSKQSSETMSGNAVTDATHAIKSPAPYRKLSKGRSNPKQTETSNHFVRSKEKKSAAMKIENEDRARVGSKASGRPPNNPGSHSKPEKGNGRFQKQGKDRGGTAHGNVLGDSNLRGSRHKEGTDDKSKRVAIVSSPPPPLSAGHFPALGTGDRLTTGQKEPLRHNDVGAAEGGLRPGRSTHSEVSRPGYVAAVLRPMVPTTAEKSRTGGTTLPRKIPESVDFVERETNQSPTPGPGEASLTATDDSSSGDEKSSTSDSERHETSIFSTGMPVASKAVWVRGSGRSFAEVLKQQQQNPQLSANEATSHRETEDTPSTESADKA